ncbi:hypothetical protein T4C_1618 [Trichinella pseudospiralis]|uniref:Integrase catalytic domain-containing protein n=1 Tax=Trichinella pseudospiralis TaxID=6337 RepID=A0A0V1JK69_TRIPS|nr:hypothetical protein T4C_1618 [Trichinella pseudospiralis]
MWITIDVRLAAKHITRCFLDFFIYKFCQSVNQKLLPISTAMYEQQYRNRTETLFVPPATSICPILKHNGSRTTLLSMFKIICTVKLLHHESYMQGKEKTSTSQFVQVPTDNKGCTEEVALKLLESFLTFSTANILQFNDGQVFSNAIIAELKTCWPVLKLVTRHPQNHGTVERLYGVLQDKLAIWIHQLDWISTCYQNQLLLQRKQKKKLNNFFNISGRSFICAERVPDVDRAAEDLKIFLVAIIAECKGLCTVGCGEG